MNEPVIDIRDRIEKMRNQITPQSSQNQEKPFQKSSKKTEVEIDKIDSVKKNFVETSNKDKHTNEHKRSISDDITEKKKNLIKILKILKQLLK